MIDKPAGPCACDKEMAGAVMVNVVDAVSGLPSLPVAITVYPPAASDGTVNVHEKAPAADVVCEVQVWVPGVAPLKVKVLIAVETEKPVPETVTVMPFGPCVGNRVMAGVVMENVFDAVSGLPSLPVATTV